MESSLHLNTTSPDLLYDAQGNVWNHVLLEHARDFALQYLRHTINGESMVEHDLIKGNETRLIAPGEQTLLVTPTREERKEHGQRKRKRIEQPSLAKQLEESAPQASAPPLIFINEVDRSQHMLEAYFIRHNRLAEYRHTIKDTLDTQRAAISVVMEQALDCAASGDQKGFNQAQEMLQQTSAISVNIIEPLLQKEGVLAEDRHSMLRQMHESATTTAVERRLANVADPTERDALDKSYQDALERYRHEQDIQKSYRDETRDKHGRVALHQGPARSFTSRVQLQQRDLLVGHTKYVPAANENEKRSR